MSENEDKALRYSVPEDFRVAKSPIGCVQNYIVALQQKLIDLGVDLDAITLNGIRDDS